MYLSLLVLSMPRWTIPTGTSNDRSGRYLIFITQVGADPISLPRTRFRDPEIGLRPPTRTRCIRPGPLMYYQTPPLLGFRVEKEENCKGTVKFTLTRVLIGF